VPDVIVNGDDYGLTAGVNKAIEEAHAAGMLTSTTVLVTGESAAATSDLPLRFPELDVGLHANLTFGSPASDPADVPSLVDTEGVFHSEGELLRRIVRRQVAAADVRREILAQAQRLREFGITPSHWDGHRGVVFWPFLVGPSAAAAREAAIPAVRSQRVWIGGMGTAPGLRRWRWRLSRPKRLATETVRRAAARRLRRDFVSPDWRSSAGAVLGGGDYAACWRQSLLSLPDSTCELVSHPGYPDETLGTLTPALTEARLTDLRVLTDESFKRQLTEQGVRFIGFRHLLR
jgi:chitin disaccharide deacetylase